MTRWEYKVVSIESTGMVRRKFDYPAMEKQLNDLGRDGWEIVDNKEVVVNASTFSFVITLKRPLKG